METFPIELPAPGNPWHATAVTLGINPGAVALVTMGWVAMPQVTVREQSQSGGTSVAWFIGGRPGVKELSVKAGRKLLLQARHPGKEGLATVAPLHPFLACLAALENLAALVEWDRKGGMVPPVKKGPGEFVTLTSTVLGFADSQLSVPPHAGEKTGITSATHAAALIACGFIPSAQPAKSDDGRTGIAFRDASVQMPALTLSDALRAAALIDEADARPGAVRAALTLPGFPAEEHPFFYAYRAVCNVSRMHAKASAAGKNPLRNLVNPYNSQRTALVTASLTAPGSGKEALKRELKKHLSRHAA